MGDPVSQPRRLEDRPWKTQGTWNYFWRNERSRLGEHSRVWILGGINLGRSSVIRSDYPWRISLGCSENPRLNIRSGRRRLPPECPPGNPRPIRRGEIRECEGQQRSGSTVASGSGERTTLTARTSTSLDLVWTRTAERSDRWTGGSFFCWSRLSWTAHEQSESFRFPALHIDGIRFCMGVYVSEP